LNVHCCQQPEDPAESRIVVTIKCSIKALAAQSRKLRQSEDILRSNHGAKRLQDDLKIRRLKGPIQEIFNVERVS
jgi:hypothetical protein